MSKGINFFLLGLIVISFSACEEEVFVPKPTGYYRIDLPKPDYSPLPMADCPFTFELNSLSKVHPVSGKNGQSCWMDIHYPEQKSKIHFSYYSIDGEMIPKLIEDSRKLAMKHLVKADNFEESQVVDLDQKVFGAIYNFEGSTASNYQFYLTDSVSNFVRGALYFEVAPNADSLAPVEAYIERDLAHLIATFSWK